MKVTIHERPKGIILHADLNASTEIALPEVEVEVIQGRTTTDDEALAGKRFQKLGLYSKPITDSETAEKAVRELLRIKELVSREERMRLSKLKAVVSYIEKALKEEGVEVEVD